MLIKNCPRCGKCGFLSRRWVRTSYRPKSYTDLFFILEDTREALVNHPSETELLFLIKDLTEILENPEVWTFTRIKQFIRSHPKLRVYYGKYWHYYIGHYDSSKYEKQIRKYRMNRIRSRPNGRKWCEVPSSDYNLLEDALKSKGVALLQSRNIIHKERGNKT